jgi:proteasome accessory factor C
MAGPTAVEVVERTIAIIPWVANQRGGYASFDMIEERFGISPDIAYRCLELAGMVSVSKYQLPEHMIELDVESDGVSVRLPQYFRQPLRPSAEQTFLLVTAAKVLTQLDSSGTSALHRALTKILEALGDAPVPVEVELDTAPDDIRSAVRRCIDSRHTLVIEYYSAKSDRVHFYRIEPWRLQQSDGHWYVQGWCQEHSAERVFRVDRIMSVVTTDESFEPPGPLPDFTVFDAGPDVDRVRLRLAPGARWVPQNYPCESVEVGADGFSEVVLAVGGTPWLERLLLQLGPEVEVLEAPDHLDGADERSARRILARYRQ